MGTCEVLYLLYIVLNIRKPENKTLFFPLYFILGVDVGDWCMGLDLPSLTEN